ncbi:hypothetical protein FGRMN_6116 [Fusarium graminum]|nr:hypothetical protein FGRMN_6116 [Fusarium graminum]
MICLSNFFHLVAVSGFVVTACPTKQDSPTPHLPPSSWNCHTHSFDPDRHPFKPSRAYTPHPAPLEDLIDNSPAENIMIVQATIEDGYTGLLENLATSRNTFSSHNILGTISWDPADESLEKLTKSDWDNLHRAGIRSVRIHGSYGGSGNDPDWVVQQILSVASHCPLRKLGWSIPAQLPLAVWSSIADTILNHPVLNSISFIADHNGSATPTDFGTLEFANFLRLLESGRLYVKIGALHRRSDNITLMEPVVKAYASAAPEGIVWGSDWPHVNTTVKGLTPAPPIEVDTKEELRLIRSWLTDREWNKMLVFNPTHIFSAETK